MRPGELLAGRFLLHAIVGSGGQAVVFQALDLQRARTPVAVKVARTDLGAAAQAEAQDVLRWEGNLLRRLNHPALPRIYKIQSEPTTVWLARDLVQGTPLLQQMRQRRIEPRHVQHWLLQLCDLLSYLHSQVVPVVVGDLKPANLVVRPNDSLMLIDLGAAHTITRRPPRKPRPRHGTPGYAAPEQMGGHAFDERADIFSMAVCAYELLTGNDPTQAPLQLDLAQLDKAAPQLAPALRWALALNPAQRCPTAAVFRSRLGSPSITPTLNLSRSVVVQSMPELNHVLQRQPKLLQSVLETGAFAQWLARQPDQSLGELLYRLRATQRTVAGRQTTLETLLLAMAPPEGSPLLRITPQRLNLGRIPLKRWRLWSAAQQITLHNPSFTPLTYRIEGSSDRNAEVRLLINGRAVRQVQGVLAPSGQISYAVVAQGTVGAQQGELHVHCGNHQQRIPWQAIGQAGISVGGQYVERLEALDLHQPNLLAALDQLLVRGDLGRWLRQSGRRGEASEIEQLLRRKPDELERILLLSRILHPLAPERFPLLQISNHEVIEPLPAGQTNHHLMRITNLSGVACALSGRSQTPWASLSIRTNQLAPFSEAMIALQLSPPRQSQGLHPITLELHVGVLVLPIVLSVSITSERWWDRLRRLLGG
jgi:serine/threonine protein kinase